MGVYVIYMLMYENEMARRRKKKSTHRNILYFIFSIATAFVAES